MPRRLLIALLLCVVLGLASSWLMPRVGLALPWYVPLIAFAAIFVGVAMNTDWSKELAGDPDESPLGDDAEEDPFKLR